MFSVAENKQMLFLNVSGMHHHNDTSIMFHCSVCMIVCRSGNALSRAAPPLSAVLLLTHCYTAPESAACPHYSHTHLPLLMPPQHLEVETRGGSCRHPGAEQTRVCCSQMSRHITRDITISEFIYWLNKRKTNISCWQIKQGSLWRL